METRFLGRSGLKVSALGFGAGTFGGKGPLFSAWGNTGVTEARRMIDLSLDAGLTFFDTATCIPMALRNPSSAKHCAGAATG